MPKNYAERQTNPPMEMKYFTVAKLMSLPITIHLVNGTTIQNAQQIEWMPHGAFVMTREIEGSGVNMLSGDARPVCSVKYIPFSAILRMERNLTKEELTSYQV